MNTPEFFDSRTLGAFEAMCNNVKFSDETLRAVRNQVKFSDQTLRAVRNQVKFSDQTLRAVRNQVKFSDQTLGAFEAVRNQVKLEGPGVAADSVKDSATTLPSTDWEDVPDSVLEFEAAEMLVDLRTWIDLWTLLARLRDTGAGGLDAGLLVVARQIDECLSGLARTAGPGGVCLSCDGAALRPNGVVCGECAALVAQMMLEAQLLGEGLSGPS